MSDKREVSSDLDYSGEPRHLLVFMDGTWNDENGIGNDGITTNIYKLFRALEGKLKNKSIPHTIRPKNADQNQWSNVVLCAWSHPAP